MSEDRYQFAKADGHIDWTNGAATFGQCWDRAFDLLRFHRGQKYRITERPHGARGVLLTLNEVPKHLQPQLAKGARGDVFDVTSEADGYTVAFRRTEVVTGGDRVIAHAAARLGTPYVFGATDCSWLSEASYFPETGDDWPHNAHEQHLMFGARSGYVKIGSAAVLPGDLLFHHNDEHVSIFLDHVDGGRVWDTEPHGVEGPGGWGYIRPGVRIRPMTGGYYCNWTDISGIGRVIAVNGQP